MLSRKTAARGIALIIVMIVIIVLGALAAGFASFMKVETTLARNANYDSDLEWLGRSGVELARYLLAQRVPNEPYDSLNQKWAGGPGSIYSMTNEILASITLTNNELGKGHFSIRVEDIERKYNLNVAIFSAMQGDPLVLKNALQMVGVDPVAESVIIDSLVDWCDPDDKTHISGTESEEYLRLDPPYVAKNGPIDDVSELLLVRGIKERPEILWGPKGSNGSGNVNPVMPVANYYNSGPMLAQVGLKDLFTPISARLVNVNTASAEVLRLVLGDDGTMSQEIIRARSGPDGVDGTEDDIPFRTVAEIPLLGRGPQSVGALSGKFSVQSLMFEVTVYAEIGKARKQYKALIRRASNRDIQVLYMYEYVESKPRLQG